jgi:DnaJ-class molecular chaperone
MKAADILNVQVICWACKGRGTKKAYKLNYMQTCWPCDGKGHIERTAEQQQLIVARRNGFAE